MEPRQGITHKEYLNELTERLNRLQSQARDNLISAKEKSKIYYDRRIKPVVLEPWGLCLCLA
jgi:hypothetical protein